MVTFIKSHCAFVEVVHFCLELGTSALKKKKTVRRQEPKGLGVTELLTKTEHFLTQTSDITKAGEAWLKPHNCLGFLYDSLFTVKHQCGKGIILRDILWKMMQRHKLQPSSFERYNRRHPCTTSTEREDNSPEEATVSPPFIFVKISIIQVACTWHFTMCLSVQMGFLRV